jgi:hypothetical protein
MMSKKQDKREELAMQDEWSRHKQRLYEYIQTEQKRFQTENERYIAKALDSGDCSSPLNVKDAARLSVEFLIAQTEKEAEFLRLILLLLASRVIDDASDNDAFMVAIGRELSSKSWLRALKEQLNHKSKSKSQRSFSE